jgi:stage IV sporulation protein FB
MRDPIFLSIPLGRLFGITIRVHLLFPVVALAMILRVAFKQDPPFPEGAWIDATMIAVLLLFSVICHEFGHCFAGRWMEGEANEILIWPLGGLAYVDIPHQPRAHFITAAAGPAVNVLLCLLCALLLAFACDASYQPPWNPFYWPLRDSPYEIVKMPDYQRGAIGLYTWGSTLHAVSGVWPILLARLFWVNWALFLFNMVLVCFPMDAGRMLQSGLWPYLGYRQATLIVIYAGFAMTILVGLLSIVNNEILILCLAMFIYFSCRTQLFVLETGGEEALFGYDFSQGYTSLERDQPRTVQRRPSWWQRWRAARRANKLQREQETREADERRLDELLEKVQRLGMNALTDEERRFMKRVSDRYRNRN